MHALRPYQHKNVAEVLALLQRGARGVLYQLPTGGGKTVVFSNITQVVTDSGWRVVIFVHRKELLRQASKALHRMGVPHGIVAPGHSLTTDRVHVASIDTVGARIANLLPWLKSIDLAIVDEAHHVVAGKWKKALAQMTKARVLGVTATPFRTDGKGLGEFFDHAVQGPGISDLTSAEFLVPAVVYAPPVTMNLSAVKSRGGDYVQSDLARVMDDKALILPAVRHYGRYCPGTPCVVFCAGIDHARHVAEQFTAAGWAATSVDGQMGDRERDAAIAGLANGRIQVLTSCDLISEGTDIPVVGAAILLRPTQSTGLYLQQVGRVLRPAPGKTEAIIIDQVDNVKSHGMPDEPRQWTLKGGIKGYERAVTATRRCRHCHRVHSWAESCPGCGKAYPKPRNGAPSPATVAHLPGFASLDAELILTMKLTDLLRIAKTRTDLECIARIKGYKPGWVRHVMTERMSMGSRHAVGGWR